MFKRILSAVLLFSLIVGCFAGCKKSKADDHDISDPSEPAITAESESSASEPNIPAAAESTAEQSPTLRSGIETLDNALKGWGQGTIVDERNCPVCSNDFNRLYGGYNAVFGGDPDVGNTVYLTFDEGYENGYTEKILDILKEKNCPAVFFVTMDYAKREPELIRRMINEGHVVGNHSTSHPSMPSLSPEKAADEITALHDYIEQHFNYQMFLFRPPKGEFSVRTLAVTQDLGYKSVFWSFAYKDWVTDAQPEQGAALNKMVSAAHGGAIYLLHAVSETNTAVLGQFIDQMRNSGYQFSVNL